VEEHQANRKAFSSSLSLPDFLISVEVARASVRRLDNVFAMQC